jgi:hypothetical protein
MGKTARSSPQARETSSDNDRSTSRTSCQPSSLVLYSESNCIHVGSDGDGERYARRSSRDYSSEDQECAFGCKAV